MIEIISIEDPRNPRKVTPKKQTSRLPKFHKVKSFLAEHLNHRKLYNLPLPSQQKPIFKNTSAKVPNQKPVPISTQKHDLHPKAHYTLDIATNQPKPQPPQKKQPTEKQSSQSYNPVTEKIWNFLQLVSTAAVLFAVAFVAMNWSAYSIIIEKRVNDFLGLTDTTTLEQLAADKQVEQNLLASGTGSQSQNLIPPLAFEVTPPDTRIVIPRINQNVPVIPVSPKNLISRDWSALEKDIQEALRAGVVHYPGTALPGEEGNVVITGHSSYFPWDPGRFKDVFALLHDLRVGDRIVVYHDQKKYIYAVDNIKVILPEQVEVLNQKGDHRLTLITCTPVGTNLKRLVIEAKPI